MEQNERIKCTALTPNKNRLWADGDEIFSLPMTDYFQPERGALQGGEVL